jgi:hypothetical protein
MPRVLIILFDAFANLRGSNPDYRVRVRVIVGWPAEDFHTQETFLELVGLTGQGTCDSKPQKTRISLAGIK